VARSTPWLETHRFLSFPIRLTGIASADAHDDLANIDTSDSSVRLAPGTTHPSLQSIGTGTRQHLVDADDMVRMSPNAEVETFLASNLDEILVGADTGGFESLRAQLFILVGDEVDAQREVVDGRTLSAEIKNADLGIGNTTVESRFGIRLDEKLAAFLLSVRSVAGNRMITDSEEPQLPDTRLGRTLFLQYR
jgi:hypothetical protein